MKCNLWTADAWGIIKDSDVDLMKYDNRTISNPSAIFSSSSDLPRGQYQRIKNLLKDKREELKAYDFKSISITWVPTTIQKDSSNLPHYISLKDFFCRGMSPLNIGSNDDMAKILKNARDSIPDDQYLFIVSDQNIFYRFYKFLYNPNTRMTWFFKRCSIFLGFWHCYKQLYVLLWKKYWLTLWSPILKDIQESVYISPKLGTLETYFTWFYSASRVLLKSFGFRTFRQWIQIFEKNSCHRGCLKLLKDFALIFDIILPMVYSFIFQKLL